MHLEDKPNNAEPTAGDENNHSVPPRSNGEGLVRQIGEGPPQLTQKELEEALAKTVEPPDGG